MEIRQSVMAGAARLLNHALNWRDHSVDPVIQSVHPTTERHQRLQKAEQRLHTRESAIFGIYLQYSCAALWYRDHSERPRQPPGSNESV